MGLYAAIALLARCRTPTILNAFHVLTANTVSVTSAANARQAPKPQLTKVDATHASSKV
jgi:hypothetical protein